MSQRDGELCAVQCGSVDVDSEAVKRERRPAGRILTVSNSGA